MSVEWLKGVLLSLAGLARKGNMERRNRAGVGRWGSRTVSEYENVSAKGEDVELGESRHQSFVRVSVEDSEKRNPHSHTCVEHFTLPGAKSVS